jgi:hypothetical protein
LLFKPKWEGDNPSPGTGESLPEKTKRNFRKGKGRGGGAPTIGKNNFFGITNFGEGFPV